MPWLVGIDEAGYGPNLGPFVLGSVAVYLPDGAPSCAEVLRPVVRRAAEDDDGRLLVDDSKQVYVGRNGLAKLERGVLPVCVPAVPTDPWTVGDCFTHLAARTAQDNLSGEKWYEPRDPLPVALDLQEWAELAGRVGAAGRGAGFAWGPVRTVVIPAPRFNALLDHWHSKAAVEATAVIALLQEARGLPGAEPLSFVVDRLGGRTHYAAIIQTAFPDGWVHGVEEGAERSWYIVAGLERAVSLCFQPRAESDHLPVALASMMCKYIREVCMRQFNRFWQAHVPGLKPTAGYPTDAARYFRAIQKAMQDLGLGADQVWRRK